MFCANCLLAGNNAPGIGDLMGFVKYRFIGNFNDGKVRYQDNDYEQTKPFIFTFAEA